MATPAMRQQTLALVCYDGASSRFLSAPVLKADGTPVDFTSGSWVFGMKCRATNPNPRATAVTVSGFTITGDASGILTIDLDASVAYLAPSLSNTHWILASNDAFATDVVPITGNLAVSPAVPLG